MALLEIQNVTRQFGNLTAVDNVTLSIAAGEFFTLLGPSGCGKTTLLRMIAGFDQPDAGKILLDGKDLSNTPPEHRPIHTVFQSYALFPHLTVADNVAFPLKMAKVPPAQIKSRVRAALEGVHLSDKDNRFPHELSGGQKQRVALARGLVNRPRLLLLDEPLGALDAKLREEMQIELINLQKEVGVTFVFVTHSQTEALALSDRIAVMNQGGVEQLDQPAQIYSHPKNRFVADFIGKINLLEGTVVGIEEALLKVAVPGLGVVEAPAQDSLCIGQKGVIALRPEHVLLTPTKSEPEFRNHFPGKVGEFLYMGDVTVYMVDLADGTRLEALLPNSAAGRARLFDVGDPVTVAWRHDVGSFLSN